MHQILIAPVGLEYDRVLQSGKFVPFTKIYGLKDTDLDLSSKIKKNNSLFKYTDIFFLRLEKQWKLSYGDNFVRVTVDLSDLDDILKKISKIILNEIKNDEATKIYINISSATKLFSVLSCRIASFFPKNIIPFYLKTTNYTISEFLKEEKNNEEFINHGLTKGPYSLIKIPILPVIELKEIGYQILHSVSKLNEMGKKPNFKTITENMGFNFNIQNERQKIAFWIRKISSLMLLEIHKSGRDNFVIITEQGILLLKLVISFKKFIP